MRGAGRVRSGAVRSGAGAGAARAILRAAAGGIFVPFFIQQQFGVETCNKGKSRVLGGFSEPCIQEPKKINTLPPSPPSSYPPPPPATHRHTHTHAPPRGTVAAPGSPAGHRAKGIRLEGNFGSGEIYWISGIICLQTEREVAFDHFYCLPDGGI